MIRTPAQTDSAGRAPRARSVVGVGLVLTCLFVGGLFVAMSSSSYDAWGALIIGPLLFLISLPILRRQSMREGDRRLFWLLAVALALKLGAGVAADFVAFDVYEGKADVAGYHRAGVELGERFRSGNFDTGMEQITGTSFPIFLNGIVYAVIGPTRLGGFLVHAWLAFWGLFLFYRAFTIAVPDGRRRTYARLVFFLPSEIFWSSLMGKDPWMVLSLGITAYGVARVLTGKAGRGLAVTGVGLWCASLVRPHVAALAVVAFAVAAVIRRSRSQLRQLAPVAKGMSLVMVAVLALVVVANAERFLERSGIETDKGVGTVLDQSSRGGAYGGSAFIPSTVRSPARVPGAVITVLFRPFLHEVENNQSLMAGLEGTFLIALCVVRFRWGLAAVRSLRRQAYVAFALAFTALFIFAFSGFANFGLLVRQRAQVMPLFLVLLAIPPPAAASPRLKATAKPVAFAREDSE